ncbi:MAG: hypothetical protein LUG85_03565 [Clostridiales bacterium]|nr:hypothetical protein [Clostridiales bacterium]
MKIKRELNFNKGKNPHVNFSETPSANGIDIQPANVRKMVNKYGRCNVQPTSASGNDYPAISQGLAENAKKSIDSEGKRWKEKNDKEFGHEKRKDDI